MELIDGPRVRHWERRPTLGVCRRVPFRGILVERDRLLAELIATFGSAGVSPEGPFFVRLHAVDMAGQMDIEVGVFVAEHGPEHGLAAGEAPAADYATLTYRDHSIRANRHGPCILAQRNGCTSKNCP